MQRLGSAAGVLLLAALGFAFSAALPAAQPPTRQVRISDLDMATPKGQRAFDQRLRAAIDLVCVRPNVQLPHTRKVEQLIQACRSAAKTHAQQQLLVHGIQVPALRSVRRD